MSRVFVQFRKHPDNHNGTWWWNGTDPSGPTISCPKCQKLHSLDHVVEADGKLDPSLVCTRCDWHEWGQLAGWEWGRIDFRKDGK